MKINAILLQRQEMCNDSSCLFAMKAQPLVFDPNRDAQVSEGIDFSDDACRMCVVIGIPYPNSKDLQVRFM